MKRKKNNLSLEYLLVFSLSNMKKKNTKNNSIKMNKNSSKIWSNAIQVALWFWIFYFIDKFLL